MKKITYLLLLFAIATMMSCSKDKEDIDTPVNNPLIGTQWEANDEIASMIWGSTISRLEFIDKEKFQEISITKGSVRDTKKGTYVYSENAVTMNFESTTEGEKGRVLKGNISGSIMTTTQGQPSGGFMTYMKK